MKTLVTGATGFIGSHLVERLRARGTEVLCLAKDTMNSACLESLGCTILLADLTNGVAWDRTLADVDTVYHLAGVTRARRAAEYFDGNCLATRRLAEACIRHAPRLRRFVFVSSLTAVGPSPDRTPLAEEARCHPVSDYGRSKMMAELELTSRGDRLPYTIVRPSAVYGPRERDMYDYIRMIRRGLEPLIGLKDKFLSLIYVSDLVDGILLAGETPRAEGKTYFLGSERPYSYREIGRTIAEVLHCHPFRVRLPHCLVYAIGACAAAAGALSGTQVFFNVAKARESVQPAWVCSVDRARTELGFRQEVSLEEGMTRACAWYRDNGWL